MTTRKQILSVTLFLVALVLFGVFVQARISNITRSTTGVASVFGHAPLASPIQAVTLNHDTGRLKYELTGVVRRNGDTLTFQLYTPTPEMLSPISDYAGAEAADNPNAQFVSTYMPVTDKGFYTLQNREWPRGVPYTSLENGDRTGSFVYVTENVTIDNHYFHAGQEEGGVTHLQAGWNLVVHEYTDVTNGSTRNYAAPLNSLNWYWNTTEDVQGAA